MLRPTPMRSSPAHPELLGLLSPLLDATLDDIRYVHAAGDYWPHGHRHDRVHEVDMGVELRTSRDRIVVSWAMDGMVHGLAVDPVEHPVEHTVPVAHTPQWRGLLGRRIDALGVAEHHAEDDCPATYWSLRVEFSGGRAAVIALGEDRGELPEHEACTGGQDCRGDEHPAGVERTTATLSYQPDGLVVLFGETTARSYRIVTDTGSAWGETVAVGSRP